jgi:hypothetical protein
MLTMGVSLVKALQGQERRYGLQFGTIDGVESREKRETASRMGKHIQKHTHNMGANIIMTKSLSWQQNTT